jgi:hypothetical protein
MLTLKLLYNDRIKMQGTRDGLLLISKEAAPLYFNSFDFISLQW